ncbi:MAG: HoxA-like transcriptional regulator [uncultured archaeon A07HN63]|jgi:Response regulators consisting of a CheY-like receiver domain and a winged-helix DNA-binding domain|nr:MAG: HoxA-like transcriptional regulator [uncultured archaeon A07HN63]
MTDEPPLVLVVEDEPDLADLYATWLKTDYRVRTAYGGEEAVDQLDDEIDVILLDRRMPGLSGDEVLEEVRERGIDCRVSMVTAVEPDFDIIEMGFDTYLVKPVQRDTLSETIEDLLTRDSYESGVQELFSLSSKKALLESEKSQSALADNEEYQTLSERIEELREELDTTMDSLDGHEDYAGFYQEFDDADEEISLE